MKHRIRFLTVEGVLLADAKMDTLQPIPRKGEKVRLAGLRLFTVLSVTWEYVKDATHVEVTLF